MDVFDIEEKEDSREKLEALANVDTKNILYAEEFNAVVKSAKKAAAKFIPTTEKFVFKLPGNKDENGLEVGDYVIGMIEGTFIIGQFSQKNVLETEEGLNHENRLANYIIILQKEG